MAVLLLPACKPAVVIPPSVSVLCYHTFDAEKPSPYSLTSRRFREQLRYLKVQRIPVISMKQLLAHLRSGAPLPPRSVVITIDDGYETARTKAWPLLREFGFPWSLYIYPQAIGRHSNALTWDEVKEMDRAGVDIQSHSMTHPLLTHPGRGMGGEDYVAWLDHELADSKTLLQKELGHPVETLAYPYGGYDERVVERVKAAGYAAAFTCDSGNISAHTDPLHLNRFVILRQTRPHRFTRYLSEDLLEVDQLSPRDGERLKAVPKEVRAHILNVDQILPGSAYLLIDKMGSRSVPVQVDPKTGLMRFILPENDQHGYFFVSLTAKDRLHPEVRREASWLFIVRGKSSKSRHN